MDYSSLILMERDVETGFVTKELGSYQVSVEAEYVKGFYVKGDMVYLNLTQIKMLKSGNTLLYTMYLIILYLKRKDLRLKMLMMNTIQHS